MSAFEAAWSRHRGFRKAASSGFLTCRRIRVIAQDHRCLAGDPIIGGYRASCGSGRRCLTISTSIDVASRSDRAACDMLRRCMNSRIQIYVVSPSQIWCEPMNWTFKISFPCSSFRGGSTKSLARATPGQTILAQFWLCCQNSNESTSS